MKGKAKGASVEEFPFPKYLKKSWLSLSPELKGLNIVGYCKALAAIEVVNLLRISSSIDRKKNNFGSSLSSLKHECCVVGSTCTRLAY